MPRHGALTLTSSLFVGCLLRPAVSFVAGHTAAAVGIRQSCQYFCSKHHVDTSITGGRTRPRNIRKAAGVGGLYAALEVEETDRLETGSVLVAGVENYGHFTMKAVALVYEHQEGQTSKAVCLDKGLDFTIGEMSSGDLGPLTNNRLFRGGEDGGAEAIMIHEHDIDGSRPLSDTGLHVGGYGAAKDLVARGGAEAEDFKFFFNHLSFPDGALELQVQKGLWTLAKLPNDVVLDTRRMRDMELWQRIEFALEKQSGQ